MAYFTKRNLLIAYTIACAIIIIPSMITPIGSDFLFFLCILGYFLFFCTPTALFAIYACFVIFSAGSFIVGAITYAIDSHNEENAHMAKVEKVNQLVDNEAFNQLRTHTIIDMKCRDKKLEAEKQTCYLAAWKKTKSEYKAHH